MNLNFEEVEVVYENKGKNIYEFSFSPLERGFSLTLGHSLRRILLTSIPGTSIVGVKVQGVFHELSEIEGSSTDMMELILRLKDIVVHADSGVAEGSLENAYFSSSKEGAYYAKDLNLPTGVEIVNENAPLIELTGEKEVEIEVFIKKGRNYVEGSEHAEFAERPDVIGVDGVFSPIERVSHRKEQVRVGQDSSYEKLLLEIETDGSIDPKNAIFTAKEILFEHIKKLDSMVNLEDKIEIFKQEEEEEECILDVSIHEMDLSVRSFNGLEKAKYKTLREIIELSYDDLMRLDNIGRTSANEIREIVREYGYELNS